MSLLIDGKTSFTQAVEDPEIPWMSQGPQCITMWHLECLGFNERVCTTEGISKFSNSSYPTRALGQGVRVSCAVWCKLDIVWRHPSHPLAAGLETNSHDSHPSSYPAACKEKYSILLLAVIFGGFTRSLSCGREPPYGTTISKYIHQNLL